MKIEYVDAYDGPERTGEVWLAWDAFDGIRLISSKTKSKAWLLRRAGERLRKLADRCDVLAERAGG